MVCLNQILQHSLRIILFERQLDEILTFLIFEDFLLFWCPILWYLTKVLFVVLLFTCVEVAQVLIWYVHDILV